jgi:predicted NBD/HSP70 family sugar kinase
MTAESQPSPAPTPGRTPGVVVGLDLGGTTINATVADERGRYLLDELLETPSRVLEGPAATVAALGSAFAAALQRVGRSRADVAAVGLDTPGPASANGVLSSKGATNFNGPQWHGFDIRTALATHLALPVTYTNDANAAALYAHHSYFGPVAADRSSIAVIIGTGLGGGVVESGRVVQGAAGMAGELGHVHIPLQGLLADGQPLPECNCGFTGDAESVASLTGITRNLLPYWLTRYPDHPLVTLPIADAAKQVRRYAESNDPLALQIFEQQAAAVGRLFTITANITDPHVYFLGGGVVEAAAHFRHWFLQRVRTHTLLRAEQEAAASFQVVPDRDMAGARGAAIAARAALGLPGHP